MTVIDHAPTTGRDGLPASTVTGRPSRLRRCWRGRVGDPSWVRPALWVLLVGTGGLYLWGLAASGWANAFYSAAVQAGSSSWKAMFFGSFDAAGFITVDKPPAALWVMDISARVFGVSSWSILVPQALEGVAAVGVLYATVRRRFGPVAGLLAGGVLATTPVAALMFRFNNPDALLVLCLVGAAYVTVRALEDGRTRWLVLAGVLVGVGFLTKLGQSLLIVPGFGVTYLCCAPVPLRRRVGQLTAAGAAIIVTAGWWIATVSLIPAAERPYIGGSTNNTLLNVIFGYNGFGRLTGHETGSVGGTGGTSGQWGATGITRMFNADMGGQISWLLPAALIMLVGLLVLWHRRPRTDGDRAQVWLWGSWLLATGIAFSFGKGIIHPYYTVALAPAIGALVGIGAVTLWVRRDQVVARAMLASTLAVTAVWSYVLLDRSAGWHPWLRDAVIGVGLLTAAALLLTEAARRRVATTVIVASLAVGLAGPAAYALDTAATPHTGSIPSAGPTVTAAMGGPGGGGGGGGGFGGQQGAQPGGGRSTGGTFPGGAAPGGGTAAGFGRARAGGQQAGQAGGLGGLLNASTPSTALVRALTANSDDYTWVAATVGSDNAAGLQLATDRPVMAIGGFNGTDPAPSLAQFKAWVASGRVHYFIATGTTATGSSGSTVAGQITAWVTSHYTATTIGGQSVYNLSQPTS